MRENIVARLMAVQTQFPTMRWDFNEWGGITIDITCLEAHELEFLRQARAMFEPA